MKKPTVSTNKTIGSIGRTFLFSRDTLQFFNQSLSDFTTAWIHMGAGILCLYAPVKDSTGAKVGTTKRLIKVNGDNYSEVVR
jgi:hypothetical protein